jgi:uncharacterized protein YdhG (YjbR/CyaY superfamily)
MRKTRTEKHSPTPKGKGALQDVEEYLARLPDPARDMLSKIRDAIRSAAPPQATETISYRMPAFKYKGVLVWYAAFANHCSLFPTAAVLEVFKNELKSFSTSKGTIQFPLDKPLPTALIKRIVKERVRQIESKQRS